MRYQENLISFYTLFRREFLRVFRIWPQTLLPAVITMTLYFLIFGKIVGSRIGVMQGFSYIQYIVPGLVMMSIINNTYMNVSSSFFGSKFQRNIEELLVSPMPSEIILWGYVMGGVARGLVTAFLVILISLFFADLHIHNIFYTLVFSCLSAILFSLAGFINGIFAKKFDDIAFVPTFVLTPLTYLGGVFYSAELLPPFWHTLTHLNPIFYMVNGFRYGLLGHTDVGMLNATLVLVGLILCSYAWAVYLFNRGVGIRS